MADDTDWDAVAEMRAEEDAQRWADEHRPEVPAVTGVTRWIRKPVEVGALLWDGTNEQAVREFTGAPSGWAMVPPGWYAVKGDDEYPFLVDPGDFEALYEPAGETGAQADPPPPVAADLEVAALQTSAGCDRLDRMVTEYGDATGAVRQAVDLLGARIHSAEDARIIAAARDALRVLEGAETPAGGPAPGDTGRVLPTLHGQAREHARGKDGSEDGEREAFVRQYRVLAGQEDPEVVLIGWCAEAIGCLFQRTFDGTGLGVTLGELTDAAAEHEGEQGERAHAYLAEINGEGDEP